MGIDVTTLRRSRGRHAGRGGHAYGRRITDYEVYLRNSDGFRRIPHADTGIRPEPRWAIEDCYILSRIS
ncbi:hypothetical protein DK389_22305 [Methylobacterium durans]|uniref:Uncharacterized protein n=1 Tax=Methylobacterium durans TaxID=2202825 RepID=A0A2U8W9E6_9HYPH|nr:hypothetical protein DK389_22305 [Methylobacterium durans]